MGSNGKAVRVLLLGANGQIGNELAKNLVHMGSITALARGDADFRQAEELRSVVRKYSPDILVNAAAYTAVDSAESEPELAMAVNADAPGVLAAEAESIGACFVHYSTDYVFDGRSAEPYTEDSPVNPLSVYGRSKLAGELAVASTCSRYLIFRTSWVFGAKGHNFVKRVLQLARDQTSLRIVADQVGAPTSAELVASSTASVLKAMTSAPATDRRWGMYHLTAAGATSWHGLASYIVEVALEKGARLRISPSDICPVSTAEYPVEAPRPANSVLSTDKIQQTFHLNIPNWKIGVNQVLDVLVS